MSFKFNRVISLSVPTWIYWSVLAFFSIGFVLTVLNFAVYLVMFYQLGGFYGLLG